MLGTQSGEKVVRSGNNPNLWSSFSIAVFSPQNTLFPELKTVIEDGSYPNDILSRFVEIHLYPASLSMQVRYFGQK